MLINQNNFLTFKLKSMKNLFYLSLLLPLAFLMSCSDDNDFSPVDLTITLSGVTVSDGYFYTVSGENISINNLEVKGTDGKKTTVANVVFDLNAYPLAINPDSPYLGIVSTDGLPSGTYSLGVTGNLLQVDSSLKNFFISYPLKIVASNEDLPEDAQVLGTYSMTYRLTDSK